MVADLVVHVVPGDGRGGLCHVGIGDGAGHRGAWEGTGCRTRHGADPHGVGSAVLAVEPGLRVVDDAQVGNGGTVLGLDVTEGDGVGGVLH